MTTARSAIKMLRRFIIFAPHHHFSFLISNFAFLIRAKLSSIISGRAALRANLEPRTPNPEPDNLPSFSIVFYALLC